MPEPRTSKASEKLRDVLNMLGKIYPDASPRMVMTMAHTLLDQECYRVLIATDAALTNQIEANKEAINASRNV